MTADARALEEEVSRDGCSHGDQVVQVEYMFEEALSAIWTVTLLPLLHQLEKPN